MRFGYLAIGLSMAGAAGAQASPAANSAFECDLPYEAAMNSMASLVIKQQREPDLFEKALDAIGVVEFVPDGITVFGQKPSSLKLTIYEKKRSAELGLPDGFKAVYVAQFPTNVATDNAIRSVVPWSGDGCTNQGICGRKEGADYPNPLLYYRNSSEFLRLECSVSINQDDL